MKRRKLTLTLVAALVLSLFLAGCGQSVNDAQSNKNESKKESTENTNQDKNLVYAMWSAPSGVFNPVLNDTVYDGYITDIVYSPLLTYNEKLELQPSLADSYEVSDDNLSVTFYLNKDAKWHDGEPVTANDVVFTFKSIMDPEYTGPRYSDVSSVKGAEEYHKGESDNVEGLQVIDEHTFKVSFKEVYAPGLSKVATRGIIPEHIWGQVPVSQWDKSDLLSKPVGSGPFEFSKYEPGQFVELKKNENYFRDNAKLDKIIFKVSNQETAMAELMTGEIDIADISSMKSRDIEQLKDSGLDVTEYYESGYQYMGFNLRDEKFQDKNVRQAFNYAINRDGLVNQLLEGRGLALDTPIAPTSWAYPSSGLVHYDYNVEKAKDLLSQAGWSDTDGDGILDKNGEKFKVTLTFPIGNKVREQSAPVIQANLKEVGIEVELESLEFSSLVDKVVNNQEFELFLLGWNLSVDPDATSMWHSSLTDKGAWNIVGFVNGESDKLLKDGVSTLDKKKRKDAYKKWGELMNDETPAVYLYLSESVKAYNPRVKNYHPSTYVDFLNVEKWDINNN